MSIRGLLRLSPAIFLPFFLGICLICSIVGAFVVATTPDGLDPIDGVVLRAYLYQHSDELDRPYGTDPTEKRIEIIEGSTANDVGVILVTEEIVGNGTLFARYAQFEGRDQDIRPGVYFLSQTMTIPTLLDKLTDPIPEEIRIVVRENMRLEEVAEAVDQFPRLSFTGDDFIALVGPGVPLGNDFRQRYGIPESASLEGFLYPATYSLSPATTAVQFRNMMLDAFDLAVTSEMLQVTLNQGKTMYEVVTVASIVEREAVLESERPQIASVYLNRLGIGQKLDADPTVQYQKANNLNDGVWWRVLTVEDYTNVSGPYNTYINTGLPPGPIVSPSLSSIRAVIEPADTPYFYFRASCSGDGSHQFSITFDEHLSKGC